MSQEYAFLKNPLDEQIICWWWGLNLAPEDRVHYEICAFSQYLQPASTASRQESKATQRTMGLAGLEGQDCSSATPKDWIVGLTVTNWSPKKGGHLDQVWSACAWFNTRSVETWDATNPIEQLILEQDRRYKSSSLIREYIRDKKCLGQSFHRNWWNEIYGSGIDGT